MSQHDLGKCVTDSLEQYFRDLDGEKPCAIYDMVLKSVEKPMLEIVLAKAGGNQTTRSLLQLLQGLCRGMMPWRRQR